MASTNPIGQARPAPVADSPTTGKSVVAGAGKGASAQAEKSAEPVASAGNRPSWSTKTRLWLGLVVSLLLILTGYLLRNVVLGYPIQVVSASPRTLVQTVVASGRVVTPQRVTVAAVSAGRVTSVPVTEGQSVRSGQLLVALDDQDLRASLSQADAGVAQAQAKLRQQREVTAPGALQTTVQSRANVVQARQHYVRLLDLTSRGFVSQVALDDARRNLDVATSQAASADLQVRSNAPTGSDMALAQASLAQAQATRDLAAIKLLQSEITAPADGRLIARSVERGDSVQPGKALMVLASTGQVQIVVQIDEKNLAKLAVGRTAMASADAFPAERFAAVVVFINPGVDAVRGAVEVKLTVLDAPTYIRQDMTVSVDIETARLTQALVLPSSAVQDVMSDAPWVLAVRKGRTVRQAVILGVRGNNQVQVLSGLAVSEQVAVASTIMLKAGRRVRPQTEPLK